MQCGIPYSLQLEPGLHWGDQTENKDQTDGTRRCLREGDDGEVSCSGPCMRTSPSNPVGGDNSAGPWQRIGAIDEGSPAYQHNTFRRALQPRWWTGSPWLLNHLWWGGRKGGGKEQFSWPLTSIDMYFQYCMPMNSSAFSQFCFTLMMTGAFTQNVS